MDRSPSGIQSHRSASLVRNGRTEHAGQTTADGAAPLLSSGMRSFAVLAAGCGHPVLLHGPTGCGKTHLAREIHRLGARSDRPFVRVNCAAIPDSLFEREMFGHVRGAFTDAREGGTGFFEAANGGTLFLDEVGEIPLLAQPKLLAVLEEGCFRRLGSPREIRVDVQIIAASNRDLTEMVRAKHFREDLYYRFSVLRYQLPPLKHRRDEIPGLVHMLLHKIARPGAAPPDVTDAAMDLLCAYPWPGNIRELENVLRASEVFARGGPVSPQHLPAEVRAWLAFAPGPDRAPPRSSGRGRYAAPLDPRTEIQLIQSALEAASGNKTKAARDLGMSRSTLWAKLQRYADRSSAEAGRGSSGLRDPRRPS